MDKIGNIGGVDIVKSPTGTAFGFTDGKIVFADAEGKVIPRRGFDMPLRMKYYYNVGEQAVMRAKKWLDRIKGHPIEYFDILHDALYSINYSYRVPVIDPTFIDGDFYYIMGAEPACGVYTLADWKTFDARYPDGNIGLGTIQELALFYAAYCADEHVRPFYAREIYNMPRKALPIYEEFTKYVDWEHKGAMPYDFHNTCKLVKYGETFAICGGLNEPLMNYVTFESNFNVALAKAAHAVGFIVRRK
ncbi:MAG: hypothetical protein IJS47_06495 [Clostridia bacterium]|nr:hypothetical protein [Clostridia bacterium]